MIYKFHQTFGMPTVAVEQYTRITKNNLCRNLDKLKPGNCILLSIHTKDNTAVKIPINSIFSVSELKDNIFGNFTFIKNKNKKKKKVTSLE